MSDREMILACVDGSVYTESVCDHAIWLSQRLDAPVRLCHTQTGSFDSDAPTDLSGAIGLGAKSKLLTKLTEVDEARGKLEREKGQLLLSLAKEKLLEGGVDRVETLHRRGTLVEAIAEGAANTQLLLLGKRGENADFATLHLGSNLERVVRSAEQPVLVASRAFKPIKRFIIAYDGGRSTRKAVDYVISQPLLRGLACHILQVGKDNQENRATLGEATRKLESAGFSVEPHLQPGDADEVISNYVKSDDMDLLVMGAYGHSRVRTLIIGSTTSNMLRSCPIPVLMLR